MKKQVYQVVLDRGIPVSYRTPAGSAMAASDAAQEEKMLATGATYVAVQARYTVYVCDRLVPGASLVHPSWRDYLDNLPESRLGCKLVGAAYFVDMTREKPDGFPSQIEEIIAHNERWEKFAPHQPWAKIQI